MICPDCERGILEKVTLNAQRAPVAIEWIACPTCRGTGIYHKRFKNRSIPQGTRESSDRTFIEVNRAVVANG